MSWLSERSVGQKLLASFMSMLALIGILGVVAIVKMASLNANTTASRGGALTAKDVPDFLNEVGDLVAVQFIAEDPETNSRLGNPIKLSEAGVSEAADAMRKLTGRVPLLPLAEQEDLYAALEGEYAALLRQMEASGENVLEAKTLDLGAKVIKVSASGGVMSHSTGPGAQQYSDEELAAIADEAHRADIMVAAHAVGDRAVQGCIRAGIDCIEHGFLASDETIQMMADHGTFLVSTTYLTDAMDIERAAPELQAKAAVVFPQAKAMLPKAIAAGVRIACGTDAPAVPHGDNAKELAARLHGTRMTTYSVHPGVVASNIWRKVPWPLRPLMTMFMISNEEGAKTSVYCATAPELATSSGRYYGACKEAKPNRLANDEALAKELVEVSRALVTSALERPRSVGRQDRSSGASDRLWR